MAYIAVEMASLPSYGAGRLPQGQAIVQRAALKYVRLWRRGVGRHAIWHPVWLPASSHRYLPDVAQAVSVTLSHGKVDVPLAMA